jgi:aminoglycoside/choline kinase family phosphotransferase
MRFPKSPDEVTTQWLTNALLEKDQQTDISVESFKISPLSKGENSALFEIQLQYSDQSIDAPKSLIAKFSSHLQSKRDTFKIFYQNEVHFYQTISPLVPLRTPDMYYADIDMDDGTHLILLENLHHGVNGDRLDGCTLDQAKLIVREIAGFHAATRETTDLYKHDWIWTLTPDLWRVIKQAYLANWDYFVEVMEDQLPARVMDMLQVVLASDWSELFSHHTKSPLSICHFDFHLDNILFLPEDEGFSLAVIDWQGPIRGRGVTDIAYFNGMCLTTEQRRLSERGLLRIYHETLVENGIQNYEFEQCWEDYRITMLECLARQVRAFRSTHRPDMLNALQTIFIPRFSSAVIDLNSDELI